MRARARKLDEKWEGRATKGRKGEVRGEEIKGAG